MTNFIAIAVMVCSGFMMPPSYKHACYYEEPEYDKYIDKNSIAEYQGSNYYECKDESFKKCDKTLTVGCRFVLKSGTIYQSAYSCPEEI